MWAETNQAIFCVDNEDVAVSDHCFATVLKVFHQGSGKALAANKVSSYLRHVVSERMVKKVLTAKGFMADQDEMYLYETVVEMIWPYDDRGRLVGEDVWVPDPSKAKLIKLGPIEVLTTRAAARQLSPLIELLPSFDAVMAKKGRAAGTDRCCRTGSNSSAQLRTLW